MATGNGNDLAQLRQEYDMQMQLAEAATNPTIREASRKNAMETRARIDALLATGTISEVRTATPSGNDEQLARQFTVGRMLEQQKRAIDNDLQDLATDRQWARITDQLNGSGIRFGEQDHIMLTRQESGMIRVTFTPKRHLGAVTVDVLPSTALKLHNYLEAESSKIEAIFTMIARQMEIGGGNIGTQEAQLREFIRFKTGRDQ